MKTKSIFISAFLTALISMLLIISSFQNKTLDTPGTYYQVYLDGKKLGIINDDEEFYNLINTEQSAIREKFGVDKVYPPNGFDIIKYTTHNPKVATAESIYAQIKDKKSFTVKGYIVTIKNSEENITEEIYVLKKELFEAAAERFIKVFVPSAQFEDYKNDLSKEITETGEIITFIDWIDKPEIKEGYISTEEKIFTDEDALSQYLLYGTNEQGETYTVGKGDTIESIAFNHELNSEEFLIANPKFTGENNLLAIGEEVSVALIKPILNLVYDKIIVNDESVPFEKKVEYDISQPANYKEVTQKGENGIKRVRKELQFINGAPSQEAPTPIETIIKEVVDEVTTRGRIPGGRPVDTGTSWGWPTNEPYVITSPYGYRWGTMHDGIDISGTGYASPIRSVQDGIVYRLSAIDNSTLGKHVIIDHQNGYYTLYAHLCRVDVYDGARVIRGQIIGGMGNTGRTVPAPTPSAPYRGTHLHFGVYIGPPYAGGSSINPMRLWSR